MKVTTIIGAEAAYVCIKTPTTTMDVRLSPGKSAVQSLEETVREMMLDIERREIRAHLIRMAADKLAEEQGNK